VKVLRKRFQELVLVHWSLGRCDDGLHCAEGYSLFTVLLGDKQHFDGVVM
jgi:hypothetical protein